MADLDVRTARTTIETAIIDALSLAYQARLPAAATASALRALASTGLADRSLRVLTSNGFTYRFSRFSLATDDGNAVIKPTDVNVSKPGRWLKTASTVTSGYAKDVLLYAGESSEEEILDRLLGRRPAFLLVWTGSENKNNSTMPGVLYWYECRFDIWALSTNLRPGNEAIEGSGVAAETAADPGAIAMIGDAKLALAGSDLSTPGVANVWVGDEAPLINDLGQRVYVQKLSIKVLASLEYPDTSLTTFDSAQVTYQLASTPDGGEIGTSNYLVSGYGVHVGTGFTKFPDAGSAYVGSTLVSSTPVAYTFPANKDTYRDLRVDGTFAYSVVNKYAAPPTQPANTLRVGVTQTNSTGVAVDKILCNSLVTYATDIVPAPGMNVSSLTINPVAPSTSVGGHVQFSSLARYTDGHISDVTAQATWTSATPAAATINSSGLATAVATGSSIITASFGGVASNSATLTVA